MIRSQVDEADVMSQKVYEDPALASPSTRLRLAERLWESGMLGWTSERVEGVRLFTVVKKYDDLGRRSLRPVWDERRANLRWRAPPFVPLGSPMALCHVDLSDLREEDRCFTAAADLLARHTYYFGGATIVSAMISPHSR